MSYTIINSIPQFNFQANRVLTYGELACNRETIKTRIAEVQTFEDWYTVWSDMAQCAERNEHYLHAAYYYRMAEFFLKADDERKENTYDKCIEDFYRGFDLELLCFMKKSRFPLKGKIFIV